MEKNWAIIKKIIITLIMAMLTSIIGFLMNQLVMSLTDSIPSMLTFSSVKGLSAHERQIYSNIVNASCIQDRLDTIGGLCDIKEDIRSNVLLPLKHPHIFFSNKMLQPSRGILLHGPPGTGKTMIARAIAAEANVPFISLGLSSLEDKYWGESSKLIRATFSLSRKIQPCILFFDEIDGMMRRRSEFDQSSTYGFKTEFLTQMDGMSSTANDAVFVIGTTNNLQSLDDAIKRRMPKYFKVDLPNEAERIQILKLKMSDEVLDDNVLKWVGQVALQFSGSDLSELIRRAASFRLQEQCSDVKFTAQLEHAKCFSELMPMLPVQKHHFRKAFDAMGMVAEDDEAVPP